MPQLRKQFPEPEIAKKCIPLFRQGMKNYQIKRIVHLDLTVVNLYYDAWKEGELEQYDCARLKVNPLGYFMFVKPPTKAQLMAGR